MKKIYLTLIIAVLLAVNAIAEDLSEYPDIFIENGKFDAYIVVGNKAPAFHVILQSKLISFFTEYTSKQISGRAKLASEIDGLEQNLIILGNPCENELESLMEGYPIDCSYISGKAGMFFTNNGNYYNLIITGSDDDIKKSVDELLNYKKEAMEGTEHNVREIEKINAIDEKQQMIEEINEKIANSTLAEKEPEQQAISEPKQELEPNDLIMPEQIETLPDTKSTGFFSKAINWLKRLFG